MRAKTPSAASVLLNCPRCRLHARLDASRHLRLQRQASSSADQHRFALPHRSLIKLAGIDAEKFLHDLLPARILGRSLDASSRAIYTAFLNAQGRILNDVFVYPPSRKGAEDTWYVEVDRDGKTQLLQHLKKHKLRSKFKLEALDDGEVGVWSRPMLGEERANLDIIGELDPRPGMGYRFVTTTSQHGEKLVRELPQDTLISAEQYQAFRYLRGIAEGSQEIIPGSALPMESNLEFFGGIDFHKGCYVGQELTIRTHHTGVIRKRILPVQLYEVGTTPDQNLERGDADIAAISGVHTKSPEHLTVTLPPPGTNIVKSSSSGRGRSVGKWLGGVGNVGLALCRLEIMTGLQLTEEGSHYDPAEACSMSWAPSEDETKQTLMAKASVPTWLSQALQGEQQRRQRKSTRSDEEDEEEDDTEETVS